MINLESIVDRANVAVNLTEVMTAEQIVKFILFGRSPKGKIVEVVETTRQNVGKNSSYQCQISLVDSGE